MTAAPAFIARDTYTGHWTCTGVPIGRQVGTFTASELATMLGADGPFIVWEFSGNTRGRGPLFTRSRYVADAEGNLHGYDSNGRKVIVHPAGRAVRVLTAKP
jgi:hypothetical protein